MSERLFDHHAAPRSAAAIQVLALIGELGFAKLLHDGTEEAIGDSEIKDDVAAGAVGFFRLVEGAAQFFVQIWLRQVARDVRHLVGKPRPRVFVDVVGIELRSSLADKAFQHVIKALTPAFGGSVRAGDAN